jgi:ABC-type uncharacterized transport system involved in gliding motility auxiliary subunit
MKKKDRYYKFILYIVVVILLNIASTTLFFRADITANNVYSLSAASKKVVSTLSEPLTIKVFFTKNLPAPYNTIERYIHDLLEEYAIAANRYFNYQFYNVSVTEEEKSRENRELAQSYGIYPVQIQNIEQDEVKFQKAYMGMVLIHGDLIEAIPTITSTEGLEYRITSAIRKMNNKISALIRLKEPVQITLYLSSSLPVVGAYMNITGLADIPKQVKNIVDELNTRHYGKLEFVHKDPTVERKYEQEAASYNVLALRWDEFTDRQGRRINADRGFAGIVVQHGEKSELIPIIKVYRLPIFGTQYQLVDMDSLSDTINESIENVVDINEAVGYLADHGTPALTGGFQISGQTVRQEALNNFNKLVSEDYSPIPVNIKEEGIPDSLSFLIIAGPKEPFSDYELYQIDQFLMKGNTLAVFLDPFKEVSPQGGMQQGYPHTGYPVPINTNLEKLLSHYGLKIRRSYVLDENSYKQNIPEMFGGGVRHLYNAPIIKSKMFNRELDFLKNIKGLVMFKASPVDVDAQKIKEQDLKAFRLFSSSERSWEVSDAANLNPMFLSPPSEESEFRSIPMAYILEGSFTSYFADKPIPEKPVAKDKEDKKKDKTKKPGKITPAIKGEGITIKKAKPAKIFLIGTSEILKDSIFDDEGKTPNAQFVMNVIDYLNNREDNAIMRTKIQRFNPIRDVKPATRTFIKSANIAGLPVLVIVAGLIVWLRRSSRKKTIQQIFRT